MEEPRLALLEPLLIQAHAPPISACAVDSETRDFGPVAGDPLAGGMVECDEQGGPVDGGGGGEGVCVAEPVECEVGEGGIDE